MDIRDGTGRFPYLVFGVVYLAGEHYSWNLTSLGSSHCIGGRGAPASYLRCHRDELDNRLSLSCFHNLQIFDADGFNLAHRHILCYNIYLIF